MMRCPRKCNEEQCRLPAMHVCECLYIGEPMSLLQGLAFVEEARRSAAAPANRLSIVREVVYAARTAAEGDMRALADRLMALIDSED